MSETTISPEIQALLADAEIDPRFMDAVPFIVEYGLKAAVRFRNRSRGGWNASIGQNTDKAEGQVEAAAFMLAQFTMLPDIETGRAEQIWRQRFEDAIRPE